MLTEGFVWALQLTAAMVGLLAAMFVGAVGWYYAELYTRSLRKSFVRIWPTRTRVRRPSILTWTWVKFQAWVDKRQIAERLFCGFCCVMFSGVIVIGAFGPYYEVDTSLSFVLGVAIAGAMIGAVVAPYVGWCNRHRGVIQAIGLALLSVPVGAISVTILMGLAIGCVND